MSGILKTCKTLNTNTLIFKVEFWNFDNCTQHFIPKLSSVKCSAMAFLFLFLTKILFETEN